MRGLQSMAACLLIAGAASLVACSSPEVRQRMAAVDTADEAELTRIALNDPVHSIRIAAVARLTSQSALGQVATSDGPRYVRKDAIRRLERQDLLEQVALKDGWPEFQADAAERLQDPEALARVVRAAPRAVSAPLVAKLADPARLAVIARDHEDDSIRVLALDRITDQELLKQIAQKGRFPSARRDAIKRIRDPGFLQAIALGDPDENVAEVAARGVSDPARLAALSQSRWPAARNVVAHRSDDQALLTRLAREDRSEFVRAAAAARITDQRILGELASGSWDPEVRRAAVERVDDPRTWAAIAKKELDGRVQSAILERTNDPAILADVLLATGATSVGCRAVGRVRDLAALRKAAATQPEGSNLQRIVQFRLLLEHPSIKRRAPLLSLSCRYATHSQPYSKLPIGGSQDVLVEAESIGVRLLLADQVLKEEWFVAQFPTHYVSVSGLPNRVGAVTHFEGLAGVVIDSAGLDAAEVAELAGPAFASDVRLAAIERIRDRAELERLLAAASPREVQERIRKRLHVLGAP